MTKTTAIATDEIRMRLATLVRDASRLEDSMKDAEAALTDRKDALRRNYEMQDSYIALMQQVGEATGSTLWPRVEFERVHDL